MRQGRAHETPSCSHGLGGFTPPPRGWGANSGCQVAARVAGPRWAGPPEQRNSCPSGCPTPGVTACPVEGTFSGLERALTWWGPTGICHPREYSSQDTGAECPAGGAVPLPTAQGRGGGWGGGRTKFTVRSPCRWPRRRLLASPPICEEAEPRGCVHMCGCMWAHVGVYMHACVGVCMHVCRHN